jgi:hypothetical protein
LDSLELVYQDDVVKLFWDASARYHVSEWRGVAPSEKLRTAAHACLTASRERASTVWLADIEDLSVANLDDQTWIATEFYPLLARNGVRQVAIVTPAKAAADESVRRVNATYARQGCIRFEYCATRADAIRALEAART